MTFKWKPWKKKTISVFRSYHSFLYLDKQALFPCADIKQWKAWAGRNQPMQRHLIIETEWACVWISVEHCGTFPGVNKTKTCNGDRCCDMWLFDEGCDKIGFKVKLPFLGKMLQYRHRIRLPFHLWYFYEMMVNWYDVWCLCEGH